MLCFRFFSNSKSGIRRAITINNRTHGFTRDLLADIIFMSRFPLAPGSSGPRIRRFTGNRRTL